ncbi:MAG: TatD family hydrolase [Puniceicoccaceae bacterium]
MNPSTQHPIWIDSHCHLDRFAARGELSAVLERARRSNVREMITVSTSPEDWDLYQGLATQHPGIIHYTVGIHPSEVTSAWPAAVEQLSAFLNRADDLPRPVAIGEIGLDYFRLPARETAAKAEVVQLQQAAFRAQLHLASELPLPIVIHCRSAQADCLKIIQESKIDTRRFIFHCFSGTPAEVQQLLQLGIRVSFTGIVTFKSASLLREAVALVSPESTIIETDCPFLAPEPHRGQQNEPAHTQLIGNYLASLHNLSPVEFSHLSTRSTRSFFQLPPAAAF